ncbi:sensor domain-containing diguanylate cyclase [Desulfobacula toluolica]|uniref:diguanylate cyclase n=1 Tax=Desulfobacula toluolica (strain DSM 7467 / Tol2) TaxID=651182 RepID=K0NQ11_DESTT|nr:sensor domain-containing diguanylate cyclase [Desulfobacula toluolica]CCK82248.1 cache domain modulated diguanylate cyclase [Desulfobacula toluolica Tol2]
MTIRKELFKSSIILSCSILIIFSILSSSFLYYAGISNAYVVIRQRNQAVNYFIAGYFTKIHNAVQFLASNRKIQNAPSLGANDLQDILNLYKSLEIADPDINYIYSGYKNGSLLINNYTPPEGYNSVVRPWYQEAIKSAPDISGGLPYKEIKTKEWLVSISKVLVDVENKINGVISIDCSIDTVANLLKKRGENYKSSYSFAVKPDGKILIHHENSALTKTVSDIINSSVRFDKKNGEFSYKLKDTYKLACYSRIDNIGWIIITVVDKSEIIKPIILQTFVSILIIGVVAVLLAWVLSASLSKRFIVPLIELKKSVNAIVTGNCDHDSGYEYPNNEIGTIATDIEQFTENELYNRNIELQTINEKLELLSITDQLTKLPNRHKINNELEKEWERAIRYKNSFSLIMIDIDWFKKINDTYGHQAGDSVLYEISQLMKNTLRSTDIVGRWGGEEFLVMCPETDLSGTKALAVKLCSTIENYQFTVGETITISAGLCEFDDNKSIEDMIKEADNNLYEAKRQGRNTVVHLTKGP